MRTDQFRFGTPRKKSNKNAMFRFALRNKAGDAALQALMAGTCTKRALYGKHPTK